MFHIHRTVQAIDERRQGFVIAAPVTEAATATTRM
jgi:hypothetical protein